jgi:ferrochelatase
LVAHGAPERLEDLPDFLTRVIGAPAPPALLAEIRARYQRIGGASPLNAISRRQADALSRRLSLPVFLALRHGHPSLPDVLFQVRSAGFDRLVAVSASPHFSKSRDSTLKHLFSPPLDLPWAPSVHRHPLFVEAIAERLVPLAQGREVLFTAHSLPAHLAAGSPDYGAEARATAAAIAARCGLPSFDFAYQSQGRDADHWLGPTVESRIDALASRGVSELVVAPLSFSADNLEVLYDIDIRFRHYALDRGIRLLRTATPGDSPLYIEALAASVRPFLEALP